MPAGQVKWFDRKKGYGFVTMSDGQDVYVHYSSIQSEGFKFLVDGEEVTCEVQDSERGPKAANVVRLNSPLEKERSPRRELV